MAEASREGNARKRLSRSTGRPDIWAAATRQASAFFARDADLSASGPPFSFRSCSFMLVIQAFPKISYHTVIQQNNNKKERPKQPCGCLAHSLMESIFTIPAFRLRMTFKSGNVALLSASRILYTKAEDIRIG